MPESTKEVVLHGCTPEPLMSYLKALGILRLIAEDREHGDPSARGFWRDDVFVLRSRLDEKGLEAFFLNHYRPTPIVAPWNGGSGFYLKWDEKKGAFRDREAEAVVSRIERSSSPRFEAYRNEMAAVKNAMRSRAQVVDPSEQIDGVRAQGTRDRWSEKRVKKEIKALLDNQLMFRDESAVFALHKSDKDALLTGIRSAVLGDASLLWLDSAFVIRTNQKKKNRIEAPLLGSGGNIGNSDFSARFMQMLVEVLTLDGEAASERSGLLLRSAVHGSVIPGLDAVAVDQFRPGQAGGANMGQGMEAGFRVNPWDYVLMLEGALMIQGATSRRLGSSEVASVFPFVVDDSPAGFPTSGPGTTRGEQWLPIWNRPCAAVEIGTLLAEGRAEVGGRQARRAVEFGRAVATLGVDRGVRSFVRVQYQARLGDNYLANSLGRIAVTERPDADLLCEIDPWLDLFRKSVATSGNKPENKVKRFVAAERQIDAAVFDFCRYGSPAHLAEVLVALGRAEREMALTPGKIGQSKTKVGPIAGLSFDWVRAAQGVNDGASDSSFDIGQRDHDFQIALSLAGIRAVDGDHKKVGPLRSNLEPVSTRFDTKEQSIKAKWAEKNRAVVWNAADLSKNLAAVLARRVMDGKREGCKNLPLAPASDTFASSPGAIASFVRGELDERRIEDLLWGLMLVDPPRLSEHIGSFAGRVSGVPLSAQVASLPPIYCLLKLLFLPRGLTESRAGERNFWNLAPRGERGTHRVHPEPTILTLLRAGRIGEAATIAMRRLRTSGLTPLPHRRSGGPSRDDVWAEVSTSAREGERLAAALLIPIDPRAINSLVHRATRDDDVGEANDPPAEADDQIELRNALAATSTTNDKES